MCSARAQALPRRYKTLMSIYLNALYIFVDDYNIIVKLQNTSVTSHDNRYDNLVGLVIAKLFCIAMYRDAHERIAICIAIYCGSIGYDIRWFNLLCYIIF